MVSPGGSRSRGTTLGLACRVVLLGVAAGSRSTLGLAAPAIAAGRLRSWAAAAVVGELVGDKLPSTPDRTEAWPFAGRLASGAAGGVVLARRAGRRAAPVVLLGVAAAAVGTIGGLAWRRGATPVLGPLGAAVTEDAVAIALAAAAVS
jgi:hypothetical protein